jgi:hypothetical protein
MDLIPLRNKLVSILLKDGRVFEAFVAEVKPDTAELLVPSAEGIELIAKMPQNRKFKSGVIALFESKGYYQSEFFCEIKSASIQHIAESDNRKISLSAWVESFNHDSAEVQVPEIYISPGNIIHRQPIEYDWENKKKPQPSSWRERDGALETSPKFDPEVFVKDSIKDLESASEQDWYDEASYRKTLNYRTVANNVEQGTPDEDQPYSE